MALKVGPQPLQTNNCLPLESFPEKEEIPKELLIKIFALLDARTLKACLKACSTLNWQWNKELKENGIWIALFHKNYPSTNLEGIKDLRKSYLDKHILHTNYKHGICSIEYINCHIRNGVSSEVSSFAVADKKLFSSTELARIDDKICVWDIGSKRCVATYRLNDICGLSPAVADGKIFSGSRTDSRIFGYDMNSWGTFELIGHSGPVRCLASAERTSKGGAKAKVLFSGSDDQTIKCWDLNSLKCIGTLPGHTGTIRCFAISNHLLFSGSGDHTIMVWDIDSLKHIGTLKGHAGQVNSLAAASKTLFSGSSDNTIRKWDIDSLNHIATLTNHKAPVRDLTVDDGVLFSVSHDHTMRIWDIDAGKCIASSHDKVNFSTKIAVVDSKVFLNTIPENKIKVMDFTAMDSSVLDELIKMYTSGDSKTIDKADALFSSLHLSFISRICEEIFNFFLLAEIFRALPCCLIWLKCTPVQKAQAIENFKSQPLRNERAAQRLLI
jgi:WD40 repeat protein